MTIVISLLFIISAFSNQDNTCYKNETNFYFINGIGNEQWGPDDSSNLIERKITLKKVFPLLNPKNTSIFPFSLLDNLEDFPSPSEIVEVLNHKIKEVKKENSPNGVLKFIVDKATIIKMDSTLSDGYNVVFAHSQGNLYANDLCAYTKKHIRTIGIATPAGVSPCGDYTTFKEDKIINIARGIPYSVKALPANISTNAQCTLSNGYCHKVEFYLDQPSSLKNITKNYNNELNIINKSLNSNFVSLRAEKDYPLFDSIKNLNPLASIGSKLNFWKNSINWLTYTVKSNKGQDKSVPSPTLSISSNEEFLSFYINSVESEKFFCKFLNTEFCRNKIKTLELSSRSIASTSSFKINNKNSLDIKCKDAKETNIPIQIQGISNNISLFNQNNKISSIPFFNSNKPAGELNVYFDNGYKVKLKASSIVEPPKESAKLNPDAYLKCQKFEQQFEPYCVNLAKKIYSENN